MAQIASLVVADPADVWRDLGFVVDDGATWVSGIRHQLGAPGQGVLAWTLRDVDGLTELPVAELPIAELPIAGLPVAGLPVAGLPIAELPVAEAGPPPKPEPTPDHPNQVIGVDHVVVVSPDLGRTIDAFESAGVRLRRTRKTGTPEQPTMQAFFRLGETIVEVVGPATASGAGPARFGGLVFTVADLEATAAFLGDRLRPAKDAVQPGRRIATLDRSAGSTVPLAFITPDR